LISGSVLETVRLIVFTSVSALRSIVEAFRVQRLAVVERRIPLGKRSHVGVVGRHLDVILVVFQLDVLVQGPFRPSRNLSSNCLTHRI
jgi:hypothetical protein